MVAPAVRDATSGGNARRCQPGLDAAVETVDARQTAECAALFRPASGMAMLGCGGGRGYLAANMASIVWVRLGRQSGSRTSNTVASLPQSSRVSAGRFAFVG